MHFSFYSRKYPSIYILTFAYGFCLILLYKIVQGGLYILDFIDCYKTVTITNSSNQIFDSYTISYDDTRFTCTSFPYTIGVPPNTKISIGAFSDPYQVIEAFEFGTNNLDVKGIIVDSLTFLMDMYETQYVLTASNTMKAWSDFNQFFKQMMQEKNLKNAFVELC